MLPLVEQIAWIGAAVATMRVSSGYVLEPLREGGDFTIYRGREHGNLSPVKIDGLEGAVEMQEAMIGPGSVDVRAIRVLPIVDSDDLRLR